jgi:beta-N-acetylhexosaminidase
VCYALAMADSRAQGTEYAQAGQFLIMGIEGPEVVETQENLNFIEEIDPFGVILFKRNVPDIDTTLQLTGAISERAPAALLSIDHEGGRVHRLPEPFTHFPPSLQLTRSGDPGLVKEVARAQAAELRAAGFHISFAPCLDIFTNPDNTVIGDRSFGQTPEEVIHNAIPYFQGLTEGGIVGCGKHFPGHGDTLADSHLELPRVDHDVNRLRTLEMVPFARAINQGFPMIMSAHLIVSALDPKLPASLSRIVLGDYLRDALGFSGVIVSDDMEMKAIGNHFSMGEAAIRAVEAGTDLLLVCKTPGLVREARDSLAGAIKEGRISRALLSQAQRRRSKLRRRAAKLSSIEVDASDIGSETHRRLASDLA